MGFIHIITDLPDKEERRYNRFLEQLHDEASYADTLKMEAEEKVREDERQKKDLNTALKAIENNCSNELIMQLTELSLEEIESLRQTETKNQK